MLWFYHNPFLSFIAGNSVCHYCYAVFNLLFLLLLMLTPMFLVLLYLYLNISVTNLYKLSCIRNGFSLLLQPFPLHTVNWWGGGGEEGRNEDEEKQSEEW